jgi:hypothetical protein
MSSGRDMAFQSSAQATRSLRAAASRDGTDRRRPSHADGDTANQRDLKKIVLIAGLGILSWVATYVGMLELIEANMGDLPFVHKAIIGFSVAMLMTMIIWLLDQMFAPIPFFTKVIYAGGYVFLTLISVGFGFGFYWKVLESRSEASRSAESAVGQVQGSLTAAATRLDQLDGTLVKLSALSTEKADLERTKGTSCPNSRPGDGPRMKMREDDAARFSYASGFVKDRATIVKGELAALDGDLMKIVNGEPSIVDPKTGTRNEFMKGLSRKLDMTVTRFNAFRTDPQLRQLRTELSDRAEQSTFGDPKKGGFICPDAQLQSALRGAVKAIDQLPELEKPDIAAVEGSEATIEAFRRLTATFFGALSFKLPPSADELRALQQKAVQSVEAGPSQRTAFDNGEAAGLSKRDYVPLSIALFVDLCLLLVSMGRPANRLGGLLPRMQAAERSPVSTILSRFNEIHRDPEVRQTFEVFRHVVFDQGGVYYVAVPLDAPYTLGRRVGPGTSIAYGTQEAQELQHEAHLLANLFTSFETERIFKRVHSPLLTTGAGQKKLARQGSKFAGCRAFRIYRFRDGAWQEIILGAVMGAAKRAEDGRAAEARDVTAPAVAMRAGAALPETDRFAAVHGPYARAAREELSVHPERDQHLEPRAANSNTAPASRPAPVTDRPAGTEAAAPTVVPLPVRPRPATGPETAQGISEAATNRPQAPVVEAFHEAPDGQGMVNVVMRRETASFRVPVSQASLPVTLFAQSGNLAAVLPAGDERLEADHPTDEHQGGAELLPVYQQKVIDFNELESSFDEDLDDVARIAGRLRPALPGP